MEGPNENCHHLAEAALSPKRHPGDTLAGILRLGPPLGLLAALLRVGMAAGPRGLIGTCRHLVGIAVTTPTGRKEPRHALGRG
jgi:hypothetical protein